MKAGDQIQTKNSRTVWTVETYTPNGELTAWRASADKQKRGKVIVKKISRPELYRVVKAGGESLTGFILTNNSKCV
jgi:hypothetical protein